ncbi:MAG: VTT domain-containing protein [Oxalobacter formigenes]|nr:VTT domain-containing protein [Oxalobacter formigenes]
MDVMQFLDMVFHVDKTLGMVISQYGTLVYVMLSGIVFCETGLVVMPFLPGDSLLFIAGAFCATGAMDIWFLAGVLIVAAVLGNTLNYWIGKKIGQRVFTRDYAWIDKKALHHTQAFFDRHGGKTITLSRFIPIVRTFAPFVAGVSGMPFTRFQFYNIAGGIGWVAILLIAGYFFGNIPIIRDHLNMIVLLGIGAAIIPVILGGIWRFYIKVIRSKH